MTPEELKALRQRLRMTQRQLGDAIGMSYNSVYRMEKGRQTITERTEKQVRALVREREAA